MQLRDRNAVWEYFHAKLGIQDSADFRGVCHVPDVYRGAVMSMDHVAAAAGYSVFIGRSVCMHVVIDRPELVTRRMVREAFEYPFVVAGCEAVIGLVDSANEASCRFARRVGCTEIHRVPNGGTAGDLVIFQMLRSECRWLRAH